MSNIPTPEVLLTCIQNLLAAIPQEIDNYSKLPKAGPGPVKHLLLNLSPSGHGVALIPIWVLYSHAGPVGTAEDLSSQTTKSSDYVKGQVIRIMCKVT